MCLLHPNHGGVLGDRGCGVGCDRSSAIGSLSIVWCLGFKRCFHSIFQGHERALYGRFDCCSGRGTMEFTQTNCSSGALIGWNSTSKVLDLNVGREGNQLYVSTPVNFFKQCKFYNNCLNSRALIGL